MGLYTHAQKALDKLIRIQGDDGSFTITGIAGTKYGVFERVTVERDMADGGYEVDYEDRLIVSKTNFPSGIVFNAKITVGGKTYTVKGIAEQDELSYTYKLYAK